MGLGRGQLRGGGGELETCVGTRGQDGWLAMICPGPRYPLLSWDFRKETSSFPVLQVKRQSPLSL